MLLYCDDDRGADVMRYRRSDLLMTPCLSLGRDSTIYYEPSIHSGHIYGGGMPATHGQDLELKGPNAQMSIPNAQNS